MTVLTWRRKTQTNDNSIVNRKPTAYVINLDRRKDRWQRTQELWSEFFELVRCPAVDLPDGARGCKLSHVQYAASALAKDAMAIILEDDAIPADAFKDIGLECICQARRHVDDYDAINLSPLLDLSDIRLPRAELNPSDSPLFLRTTYSHSTNFVIYNHRTLPILRDSLTSQLPIDMYLGVHAFQWVPIRLLATQSFDDSDIRKPFPNQHAFYDLSAEMLNQAVLNIIDHDITQTLKSDD